MEQVSQEMGPAPGFDGFDQWCATRDRREASIVSARYVPREMIGYEDLDEYGAWRNIPPYGWVWMPTGVAAGWAPYRFGHWAWVEPWGWTWVDDAPWGFAPFHYGRWAFVAGGWVWAPGRVVVGVRPVYAPALVAFVGGPRFSVAVGIGGGVGVAAWFPLGPGEVYRPAYHVSEVYVRNVNIVHVTNVNVINNVNVTRVTYVNQNVAGAVTVVPHTAFAGGRPVAVAAVAVRPGVMAQAEVVETARVAPTREAVLGHGGAVVAVHAPPARFVERTVVARNTPPPTPVAFGAKEQALRANGGRPLEPAAVNNMRPAAPPHPTTVRSVVGANGAPAGTPAGQGGEGRRFGGPRPDGDSPEVSRPMMGNDRPNQRPMNQPSNTPPPERPRPVVTPDQHPAPAVRTEPPQRNPEVHQESVPRERRERPGNQRKDTKKTENRQ
jgi:hypothetical protein